MVVHAFSAMPAPDEVTLENTITGILDNLPHTFMPLGSDQEAVEVHRQLTGPIDYPEDMESHVKSISVKTFSDAFLVGKEYLLHAYTLHFKPTGELYQADAKIVRCYVESEKGRTLERQISERRATIKNASHFVGLPDLLRYYVFARQDNESPITIVGEVLVQMPKQCTLLREQVLRDGYLYGDHGSVTVSDLNKETSQLHLSIKFNPEEGDPRYLGAGGRWEVCHDWQGGTNLVSGEHPLRLQSASTPPNGDAQYAYRRSNDGSFEVRRQSGAVLKPRSLAELDIPPISGIKASLVIYDPKRLESV